MNRDRFTLICTMLEAMPNRKTRVFNSVSLSHSQLKDYMKLILVKGLTVEKEGVYYRTEKGEKFLIAYRNMIEALEG